jgi:tetratricopeptide (TPR) repeat protein
VLKSGEIQKELQTLTDITTDLKDIFNTISNNIVTLSKKQDVVSAVIDKRGEGVEGKITLLKTTIDKLTEISTEGSAGIKKAISELSITFENQFKSLENILQENDKNRKTESDKIIETLSLLPEQLNTYYEANKDIVDAVKDSQSSIANFSKSIEELTRNIVENDKKREEKEKEEIACNHLSKGVILFYRGSLGAAEKEIRKALELKKNFAEAYINLGMVQGEMGRTEEAIKNLKRALEIEPGLEEAYNNLGVIQLRGEKYEEAIESFNEAIKLGFKYPTLYLNMSKALIGLERIDEAIGSLRKVLEIDPTNTLAKELLSTYEKGGIDG